MRNIKQIIIILAGLVALTSCDKLVAIDDPIDSITTNQVFRDDVQAKAAMAGVYSKLANGNGQGSASNHFSAGLSTVLGGLSADELSVRLTGEDNPFLQFSTNKILVQNAVSPELWSSAYTTIYNANSVIEGIAASTSSSLSQGVRKKLTAESKVIRAFCYFYLVNFFGDLPLVLTVDFNETRNYTRTPVADVYKQIIKDLKEAQVDLPTENTGPGGARIYADKWAATALLARAYLYTRDYENAYREASAVIANTAQFGLEMDLDKPFLKTSREAIWQFENYTTNYSRGNATGEGAFLIPGRNSDADPLFSLIYYHMTDELVQAFEPTDKRLSQWVGVSPVNNTGSTKYFAYKYKMGYHNRIIGGEATEYYTALRLAEQFLIRAEAAANGAAGLTDAIDDLNAIRFRAGLNDLPDNLSQQDVFAAIEKERRTELFLEWGHRWFDLKRTGKASSELSQMSAKQPWAGDYQLLYPIPVNEIINNRNLAPNPGYN
ncbi:RagB/SusD family nutrient uptake outer membrane protein [Pseudoflavitalea rhizosphaerae]|uniref:RagB/SusD family nutrient uptake outer membrane protein n=1 Tax=Pseudoflavitalea rhizosphaerae TaxID=1884793 RepID=UPI000F8EC3CA|nr:RagB/SusD family nutrient uptake outer membrane protein [Pseudoflavitalea rhizosphaerae]